MFVSGVLALGVAFGPGGCYSERRDVNYKPFFTGIPGAQTQTPATSDASPRGPEPAEPESLVVEGPDGTRRLISRSATQLMGHVKRTLAEEDEALFVDQVLSERTRLEFVERGLDPGEAYRRLKADQPEILKLFSRMSMGERSPFVVVTKLDDRTQRLQLTGQAKRDLKYTGFDMTLEGAEWVTVYQGGKPVVRDGRVVRRFEPSNWRLRWFVD